MQERIDKSVLAQVMTNASSRDALSSIMGRPSTATSIKPQRAFGPDI